MTPRSPAEALVLTTLRWTWPFYGIGALYVVGPVLAWILGALAVLRVVTFATDVSIFALNLAAAMGLALAIDYTLLLISRYRDELAGGDAGDVEERGLETEDDRQNRARDGEGGDRVPTV